jgi:hypothetical protein
MPNNKKKPIGSKNFLNQIKNLNKQGKKPKLIRKILKLSYHKNMVPSINVINLKNIKNLICRNLIFFNFKHIGKIISISNKTAKKRSKIRNRIFKKLSGPILEFILVNKNINIFKTS